MRAYRAIAFPASIEDPKQAKAVQAVETAATALEKALASTDLPPPIPEREPTQDEVRAEIKSALTSIGCIERGNISGKEFLIAHAIVLRAFEVLPPGPLGKKFLAIAANYDANNSAQRQRVCEGTAKEKLEDKYANI